MGAKLKLIAIAIFVLVASLSLLALLEVYRFQKILIEVHSSLISVPAQTLKGNVERSLSIGLPLKENAQIIPMLELTRRQHPNIGSIHLVDLETELGKVMWESGPPLKSPEHIAHMQMRTPELMWFSNGDNLGFIQSWPIADPLGREVANLVIRFDKKEVIATVAEARHYLLHVWDALCLGAVLVLLPLLLHLLNSLERRLAIEGGVVPPALVRRASFTLVALGLCTTCLLTWMSLQRFEKVLLPGILAKGGEIGMLVRTTVDDAVKLGVPFESLEGMQDFLANTLAEHPEIAYINIQRNGLGGFSWPPPTIQRRTHEEIIPQKVEGTEHVPPLNIGVRADFVAEKLYVMFGDAIAMLFVTLVAGIEIALFAVSRWLLRPLQEGWLQKSGHAGTIAAGDHPTPAPRLTLLSGPWAMLKSLKASLMPSAAQLASRLFRSKPTARDMRIAMLMFVLSEEMLRSFFPLHVKEITEATSRLMIQVSIGAPLIVYMLCAGLGSMYGGDVIARMGLRRAFGISVLVSILCLIGLAQTDSLTVVIILRCIQGVFYSIATIACHVYITRVTTPEHRSRDIAIAVSAITAAGVCGAPVGALVADMLGTPAAFLFAATLAGLSWLVFSNLQIPEPPARPAGEPTFPPIRLDAGFGVMLRDWPVMSLILFAVVPNKIMLSGMLFYIVPLLLQKYHLAQATTGQFFLLYYAFLMAGNHFSSRMPDNTLSETWRMSFGVLLSGLGALPLFWFNNPVALGAAVVIFGIGQGICQTPIQISLQKLVQTRLPSVPQQKAIALLRTFERVGGIVGAALAVALSVVVDYRIATAAIGVLTFLMALGTLPLLFNMTDMEKRT